MNHYYIIYVSESRDQVKVLELDPTTRYDLHEYLLASRQHFTHRSDAVVYGRKLALIHNKVFVPHHREDDYLD